MTFQKAKLRRSSTEQFNMDFGRIPDEPRLEEADTNFFNIAFINKYQKNFYHLKAGWSSLNSGLKEPEKITDSLVAEQVNGIQESFSEARAAARASLNQFNQLKLWQRLPILFFLLLVAPAILLLFVILALRLIFRSIWYIANQGSEFDLVGGYFSRYEPAIVYINKDQKSDTGKAEFIITHEHIHLLQNRFDQDNGYRRAEQGKKVLDPSLVLQDKFNNQHCRYLLELNEVEARLHELVLSAYRHFGKLPMNKMEFLNVLRFNLQLKSLFRESQLPATETQLDETSFSSTYETRSQFIGDDMFMLLASMKRESMDRFIHEVLTVMYCNLLTYYGASIVSEDIYLGIARPNLYDELYFPSNT